jgi:hypothetical protein
LLIARAGPRLALQAGLVAAVGWFSSEYASRRYAEVAT